MPIYRLKYKYTIYNERTTMLLFKVREIRSPIMDEFRGYRMALAIPNDKGFAGKPSFTGKFLIAESSDFTDKPTMLKQLVWVQEWAGDEMVAFLDFDKEDN